MESIEKDQLIKELSVKYTQKQLEEIAVEKSNEMRLGVFAGRIEGELAEA